MQQWTATAPVHVIVLFSLKVWASFTVLGEPALSVEKVAEQWWRLLQEKTLPYWYGLVDWQDGGYLLNDPGPDRAATDQPIKQLVTQSRMVWAFSYAHRLGLSTDRYDYFAAAKAGYNFLISKMRDPLYGGYYWKVKPNGEVMLDRKYLYGQAFVIYALVEFFRAGGPTEAIEEAQELFQLVQQHMHDNESGGWFEHFYRNWERIDIHDQAIEVEIAGLKSANAHLHWMEALTELYEVTHEPQVRKALEEALAINKLHFYPPDGARCRFWKTPQWGEVSVARSDEISYGHNVEFAWLMIRAETVLGHVPDWPHFNALIQHALQNGADKSRGGMFNLGRANEPAFDKRKVWWVQAEWIAALSTALAHQSQPDYLAAAELAVNFVDKYMIDRQTGVWLDTVDADGSVISPARCHPWKGAYHDLRGQVMLINRFTCGRLGQIKR